MKKQKAESGEGEGGRGTSGARRSQKAFAMQPQAGRGLREVRASAEAPGCNPRHNLREKALNGAL